MSMWFNGPVECVNGVHLLAPSNSFEVAYGSARGAEKRLLTDDVVRQLPRSRGLWNDKEWRLRARSCERLLATLCQQGSTLSILEMGCGNGWLAGRMQAEGHRVLAADLFTRELEQGARVFPEVTFARADLFTTTLPRGRFDVVVFAASLQYFPSMHQVMERCSQLLRPKGVVHVVDTVLYATESEARGATERSNSYFLELDVPEMSGHYHAHSRQALNAIPDIRYLELAKPSWVHRFNARWGSPFTHLVIGPFD